MTDYRYVFGTLRTEQVVEEIPLFGVIMNMTINVGGDFQGTFQLDQTGKSNDALISATIPGRTWVTCERNGIPIWHGFIWSRVYSAQSKTMQLFAQSFEKYPKKRLVRGDLTYNSIEQRNIFRDLWNQMQASVGGNLNVNVPAAFATVVPKSLAILATDFKFFSNAMSSLSDAENGFDWYISLVKEGTYYRKDLQIGYPRLGTDVTPGMNVFEYPGNITQYYLTEPMADAGTHVYVIGAGEGPTMISAVSIDQNQIDTGSLIWDVVVSRKDIDNQSLIDDIARQEGAIRTPPMSVIKAQVKANLEPVFGSYNLGDTCKIVIKDARNPGNGFVANKRLLRWELRPQSSSDSEEAFLTFEGDPDL